jgi:hypothetical protein
MNIYDRKKSSLTLKSNKGTLVFIANHILIHNIWFSISLYVIQSVYMYIYQLFVILLSLLYIHSLCMMIKKLIIESGITITDVGQQAYSWFSNKHIWNNYILKIDQYFYFLPVKKFSMHYQKIRKWKQFVLSKRMSYVISLSIAF